MCGDGEARAKTAKLFWNGGSQAVRLPKEFHFQDEEVRICRVGAAVLLEPVSQEWVWLDAIQGTFTEDFLADRQQPGHQEREGLDTLFD
jgi:antitoxin VapB